MSTIVEDKNLRLQENSDSQKLISLLLRRIEVREKSNLKLHKLMISLLILTLLAPCAVSLIDGSPVVEQEYDLSYNGISFRVKVVIETEADGNWKPNTAYQIDYDIYVSDIDRSVLNDGVYSLHAYSAWLYVNGYTATCELVTYSTVVGFKNHGLLTIKYTPTQEGTERLRFTLNYEIYKDGQVWTPYVTNAPSASWVSPDSDFVRMNVVSQNDNSNLLLYIAIGLVAIIILVGGYLVYRLRRKRIPPPP